MLWRRGGSETENQQKTNEGDEEGSEYLGVKVKARAARESLRALRQLL